MRWAAASSVSSAQPNSRSPPARCLFHTISKTNCSLKWPMTAKPWWRSGSCPEPLPVSAIHWGLHQPMPTRPCWVEISTHAFENNFRCLDDLGSFPKLAQPNAELLAIVKADAYGHSVDICAPAAVRAGARWLGVTSVEEGLTARRL